MRKIPLIKIKGQIIINSGWKQEKCDEIPKITIKGLKTLRTLWEKFVKSYASDKPIKYWGIPKIIINLNSV